MTDCATVRTLALALPEAEEHNHRGRPAFRVRGKIFATLWPDEGRMVVKLPPAEQAALAALAPQLFAPVPGGWGVQGWTNVYLAHAHSTDIQHALLIAWRLVAPRQLVSAHVPATD